MESVAIEFLKLILNLYENKNANISTEKISKRYGIDLANAIEEPEKWISDAAEKHTSGDKRRMAHRLLEDFRNQMLGQISIEVPK